MKRIATCILALLIIAVLPLLQSERAKPKINNANKKITTNVPKSTLTPAANKPRPKATPKVVNNTNPTHQFRPPLSLQDIVVLVFVGIIFFWFLISNLKTELKQEEGISSNKDEEKGRYLPATRNDLPQPRYDLTRTHRP